MISETIEANVVEASGQDFVQGTVPKINEVHCLGCAHSIVLRRKLGPNVLDSKKG